MVALGEVPRLAGTQHMPANTPFLARTTIPLSHRFPIPTWAPRSGRGIQFHKWWSAVRKLLAAFDLPPDCVNEEAPGEECVTDIGSVPSPSSSPYVDMRSGQLFLAAASGGPRGSLPRTWNPARRGSICHTSSLLHSKPTPAPAIAPA